MAFNLDQIQDALKSLCTLGSSTDDVVKKIGDAKALLQEAIKDLDGIPVAGKSAIDTLLGCILALEQITGGDDNG